jgi:hypothetical protein
LWITKNGIRATGHGVVVADDRLDAREVVRRLGGTADWNQILRHSTSHAVRRALGSGELRRVARGRYALPELPLPYQAAAAAHGLVSHGSAAQHWKLQALLPPDAAHITVPSHARPRLRPGVSVHFSNVPGRDDHNGVTSPLRTVLDCALALPLAEALSIADSALRQALLTPEELIVGAHQRRGPGRQRIIRVATLADSRAANPFESGLRAIVVDAGLTGFEPQHPVAVASGTAWVDLGDPRRRIALEADSFEYHMTPEALLRDCRRYDELVVSGWLPLRFSWQHVMFDPTWVARIATGTCELPGRSANRLGPTFLEGR